MTTPPLTLHIDGFWMNPWDFTVWVALGEKGATFSTSIALINEGTGLLEPLRRLSITERVPTLQHGEFWLSESMAIIEYLEETFPPLAWPRLLPLELHARARARQVMSWLRTSLSALVNERPSWMLFYPQKSPPPLSPEGQQAADELVRVATQIGAGSSGSLFGSWCIADADLMYMLMRLHRTGHPLPEPIVDYAHAVWARPTVRSYLEHRRPPHPPSY